MNERTTLEIIAPTVDEALAQGLTQLGLTIDRATCVDNLRRILDVASAQEDKLRTINRASIFAIEKAMPFMVHWLKPSRAALCLTISISMV